MMFPKLYVLQTEEGNYFNDEVYLSEEEAWEVARKKRGFIEDLIVVEVSRSRWPKFMRTQTKDGFYIGRVFLAPKRGVWRTELSAHLH